ncbi:MAG: ATPase [Bacteroidetes bacterium]|nr:MAG: ATPase [Bacteroidota bacterium]
MKTSLLFDFEVDKSSCTVFIKKEFDSDINLVWDAFTKKEILDRWWAPQLWISKTKYMDFKVGGKRFYSMVSPIGQEYWSTQNYTSISPKRNFKFTSVFTDKEENRNSDFPGSEWSMDFIEGDSNTIVGIMVKHQTIATLQKHVEMGFRQGFTKTLELLDSLLDELSIK